MGAELSASRRGLVWAVLVLAAGAGLFWWWLAGRPVALPDAPSTRIACVSYAPFRAPGETPLDPRAFVTPERIETDLAELAQRFDCVRTYAQGQGLSAVPEIAARHGLKVLLGVWLGSDRAANAEQVRLAIATANAHPEAIRAIVVGNEVLLRGELPAAEIARQLRAVHAATGLPVTYADVWEFWLAHPELAAAADIVTVHMLPYWEDRPVPSARAVGHVLAVYADVRAAFPGKSVMIGETGWPSAGRPRRAARASRIDEARYVRGFLRAAAREAMPYNLIEAYDQPWKRALEGTVGGYWGLEDVHGAAKFALTGPVVEIPRWWLGWIAAAAGALLFALRGGGARPAWLLAGLASGSALAWQARQMAFACRDAWEWSVSIAACLAALGTALLLARALAARLAGRAAPPLPSGLHAAWLFGSAYYGLLLAFDGRYRDFPLGLFALPCVGFALLAVLEAPRRSGPTLRFLACWPPLLAAAVLLAEAGLNPTAWGWLALNVAITLPLLPRRAGTARAGA